MYGCISDLIYLATILLANGAIGFLTNTLMRQRFNLLMYPACSSHHPYSSNCTALLQGSLSVKSKQQEVMTHQTKSQMNRK